MHKKLHALCQAILREAEGQRINVGAVRLVKLLYLLEVEFYKTHGRTLTDATWRYYLYGPYPDEFRDLAEQPGIMTEDVPLVGNRVFRRFAIEEAAADWSSMLPPEETRLIPWIVKEWGDVHLNSLLNYVYFHTAPMQAAKRRGEVLDFSRIPLGNASRPTSMFRLARSETLAATPASMAQIPQVESPAADLEKIRSLLRDYVGRERSKPRRLLLSPRKDATYFEALERLNAAERSAVRGEIEVMAKDFPFLSSQE